MFGLSSVEIQFRLLYQLWKNYLKKKLFETKKTIWKKTKKTKKNLKN